MDAAGVVCAASAIWGRARSHPMRNLDRAYTQGGGGGR